MYLVGVTGAMGAGKSTVARLLAECGASLLDADQTARAVTAPGTPGLAAVVARFGADLLTADGALDRRRLGERVFADAGERQALETLLHPRIWALQAAQLAAWDDRVVVLDVPLLFETGADRRCDLTVAVRAGEARRARLAARGEMTAAAQQGAQAGQWDEAAKCRAAQRVIDNSGDLNNTLAQVTALWREIRGLGGSGQAWPTQWR